MPYSGFDCRLATKVKLLSSKIEVAQSSSTIEQFCQDFRPSTAQCFEDGQVAAAAAQKQSSDSGHVAFVQQTLLRCLEDGHVEAAQSFAQIHWRNPPTTTRQWPPIERPWTGASQETGPAQSLSRIQWGRVKSLPHEKTKRKITIGCGLDDKGLRVTQVAFPGAPERQWAQSVGTECVLETRRMDCVQAPPKPKLSANGAVCSTGVIRLRRSNSSNSCSSATSHRTRAIIRKCEELEASAFMMTQDLEVNKYLVIVGLGLIIPFLSVAFGLLMFVMLDPDALDAFTNLGDVLPA